MNLCLSSRRVLLALRSLFFISFFLFVKNSFGQDANLTGKVTDSTGNPLSGATVNIKGTNKTTRTNDQGNFAFSAAPQSGKLIVSFVGYFQQEVAFSNGLAGTIMLQEAIGRIEEVIVTAENRAVSVQRVPIAIDLVRGSDLKKLGVVDISQLPEKRFMRLFG